MRHKESILKRFSALVTALCLCLSALALPARAADPDLANSWRYSDGTPIVIPSQRTVAFHPEATLLGIDVSHHQGDIDWEAVKNSGVDFAIIRCGYGMDQTDQDDRCFEYNASECERLGIPYGVYLYSYATTVERAANEADHVLRLLEGRTLAFPVYYDMEDDTTAESDLAAIARTFCDKVSAAGYPVGIYANVYWWNNLLTDPIFDSWHRWVAHYNPTCGYEGSYAMWQYACDGTVDGIQGSVDMNFLIGSPADHNSCNHYFRAWSTLRDATCTETGLESRTCLCGAEETRDTAALGHSYSKGVCTRCGYEPDPGNPFSDVPMDAYYHDAVLWAVDNGITAGYGTSGELFAPEVNCTRAQVVTFLWRAAGSPAPTTTENPFEDLIENAWYYDAVLWAAENGITAGYGVGGTQFRPDLDCTRAQVVTFLWRASGSETPTSSENPFTDVSDSNWYYTAVLWAAENGITAGYGVGGTQFRPDLICTRSQTVTFLYRACN